MTDTQKTLKAAQIAADNAFQAALEAQHGKKLAGDYRYQRIKDNATTRAARDAYRAATEAYHAGNPL